MMPFITGQEDMPAVTGLVAAAAGCRVDAYAPKNTDTAGVPSPGAVVAWAQVADPSAVGGVRVDPVFLAGGQTWTPDQFRAAYGEGLELKVSAA